jgi:hypothetical protein
MSINPRFRSTAQRCKHCDAPVTWTEQKWAAAELRLAGYTNEEIKRFSPVCRLCARIVAHRLAMEKRRK